MSTGIFEIGPAKSDPRRGVKRWRLTYGRGHRKNFIGTKSEAVAERTRWVASILEGKIRLADGTVGQALNDYLQHADMQPKTRVETERIIRLHLAPLAPVKLSKLAPATIEALYRELGQGLAAATVRRTHAVLRAALERAVRLDLISSNPAARVQPPSGKRSITIDVDTSIIAALVDAAKDNPRLYTFIVVAASTGCRRGELCARRWADIDLERGTMLVHSALSIVGKEIVEKTTKSGAARTVMLPPLAVEALRAWRRQTMTVAGWVFPATADGLSPWSPRGASDAWEYLCRKHGEHVRLHDLRHWAASANLRAGMSVAEVAAMLGHSSPHVTMSIYAHVVGSARPFMALDDALGRGSAAGQEG